MSDPPPRVAAVRFAVAAAVAVEAAAALWFNPHTGPVLQPAPTPPARATLPPGPPPGSVVTSVTHGLDADWPTVTVCWRAPATPAPAGEFWPTGGGGDVVDRITVPGGGCDVLDVLTIGLRPGDWWPARRKESRGTAEHE